MLFIPNLGKEMKKSYMHRFYETDSGDTFLKEIDVESLI